MSKFVFNSFRSGTPFARSRRLASLALVAFALSACGGGGGGSSPVGPNPTPTASSNPVSNQSAYTCDTSDTPSSVARRGGSAKIARRPEMRGAAPTAASRQTGLLAVTYSRTFVNSSRSLMESRERVAGASLTRELDFAHIAKTTRILAVPLATRAATAARLRAQPGVLSVTTTGARRHAFNANQYFTTDPYFVGFPSETATDGTVYPQTQGVSPYYEAADVEGQWDMHAIKLEYAFGYSQSGAGAFNANAVGSSNVKLAVIDSGQDTNNDDLGSKIVYQRCFITSADGTSQSTSNFTTDQDGHGTVVAAIAAADFNNSLGFVGSGGATSIYGYRVDPTPDDNCADETKAANDDQCGANPVDIASAVEDAVTQNVNVINLSVGADPCVNGQDSDTTEGNAIADAIAAKIVVVAAAGNDASSTQAVASPACDPSVIAAGASALDDGTTDGSSHTGGSSTTPVEYVASYSQYGSPASAYRNTSAWGIVAPGGDPTGSGDQDDFHWIENSWTTTPFDTTNFAGFCAKDYPNEGTSDSANCHTLIAGTSMASPSVAGSAALIIAANSSYQSPTLMKQLLCSTTDDIGDPHEGCGRLNVYRAMATALNDPNKP